MGEKKDFVYIDLEKFFDNVLQDKLMYLVHGIINDGDTESLIRKYLKAGAMVQGKYEATEKGTPQGGNLSQLLSNISQVVGESSQHFERRICGASKGVATGVRKAKRWRIHTTIERRLRKG